MSGLTSAKCSGECTAGYFCLAGNIITLNALRIPETECVPCVSPVSVHVGSVAGDERACGSDAYYCPPGASSAISVGSGNFTGGGLSSATRTNQQPCMAGSYCTAGIAQLCAQVPITAWCACVCVCMRMCVYVPCLLCDVRYCYRAPIPPRHHQVCVHCVLLVAFNHHRAHSHLCVRGLVKRVIIGTYIHAHTTCTHMCTQSDCVALLFPVVSYDHCMLGTAVSDAVLCVYKLWWFVSEHSIFMWLTVELLSKWLVASS